MQGRGCVRVRGCKGCTKGARLCEGKQKRVVRGVGECIKGRWGRSRSRVRVGVRVCAHMTQRAPLLRRPRLQ